jgi:hypothetical protein
VLKKEMSSCVSIGPTSSGRSSKITTLSIAAPAPGSGEPRYWHPSNVEVYNTARYLLEALAFLVA